MKSTISSNTTVKIKWITSRLQENVRDYIISSPRDPKAEPGFVRKLSKAIESYRKQISSGTLSFASLGYFVRKRCFHVLKRKYVRMYVCTCELRALCSSGTKNAQDWRSNLRFSGCHLSCAHKAKKTGQDRAELLKIGHYSPLNVLKPYVRGNTHLNVATPTPSRARLFQFKGIFLFCMYCCCRTTRL